MSFNSIRFRVPFDYKCEHVTKLNCLVNEFVSDGARMTMKSISKIVDFAQDGRKDISIHDLSLGNLIAIGADKNLSPSIMFEGSSFDSLDNMEGVLYGDK